MCLGWAAWGHCTVTSLIADSPPPLRFIIPYYHPLSDFTQNRITVQFMSMLLENQGLGPSPKAGLASMNLWTSWNSPSLVGRGGFLLRMRLDSVI